MATWRSIEYTEVSPRSPDEQAAQDASRVLRTLDFPGNTVPLTFERREYIRRQFLGYSALAGNGSQNWVSRVNPHFYPAPSLDQGPYLYAQSFIHSEMISTTDSETSDLHAVGDRTALHPRWRVMIEYRTLPWEIKEDDAVLGTVAPFVGITDEGDVLRQGWIYSRNIAKRVEQGGRLIIIPGGMYKYAGTDPVQPTREPIPINEVADDVHYMWTCPLDGVPEAVIEKQLNTVNDAPFDGYSLGTLLLLSAAKSLKRDPFGQWIAEITYRMKYSPKFQVTGPDTGTAYGHNAILWHRSTGTEYHFITTDGSGDTGKMPYRYTKFANLFRPKQP